MYHTLCIKKTLRKKRFGQKCFCWELVKLVSTALFRTPCSDSNDCVSHSSDMSNGNYRRYRRFNLTFLGMTLIDAIAKHLKGGNDTVVSNRTSTRQLLKSRKPENLSDKEVVEILHKLNKTHLMDTRSKKPPKRKSIHCSCNHCKKTTCTSYEGCFSSRRYYRESGKEKSHSYGCLYDEKQVTRTRV